ncbi:DUF4145 domain-containing protein [Pyxidicoccus sp. MSG2]|uniref:DUF4145 domain-containing protein n=1 Tax=Pyxidicoccus sp. MSG2 TaxID=2996790 RepID=UPI00226FC735|nr:DUF4145 domain-containing protein [Pyxidicoccus sp. MSG2]MCY1023982.1 DUF4145 domain-containing protein [Pyxidicoccus sp. MSG2]
MQPRPYVCGWCGDRSPGAEGLEARRHYSLPPEENASGEITFAVVNVTGHLRFCEHCNYPTFIETFLQRPELDRQYPPPSFGEPLPGLPADLGTLYEEARHCMAASAFTAAVMLTRKILLHIAAERGAPAKALERFWTALEYLFTSNTVPRTYASWVDRIRDLGNETNHRIQLCTKEKATDSMAFTTMLLKVLYVLPAQASSSR